MLKSGRNEMNGEESKKINDNSKKTFDKEDKYRLMEDKEDRIQTLKNKQNSTKEI